MSRRIRVLGGATPDTVRRTGVKRSESQPSLHRPERAYRVIRAVEAKNESLNFYLFFALILFLSIKYKYRHSEDRRTRTTVTPARDKR